MLSLTRPQPPQDKTALLQFGKANAVDFVALSFTRSAADLAEARAYLNSIGMRSTKLIAKIENKVGGKALVLGGGFGGFGWAAGGGVAVCMLACVDVHACMLGRGARHELVAGTANKQPPRKRNI